MLRIIFAISGKMRSNGRADKRFVWWADSGRILSIISLRPPAGSQANKKHSRSIRKVLASQKNEKPKQQRENVLSTPWE